MMNQQKSDPPDDDTPVDDPAPDGLPTKPPPPPPPERRSARRRLDSRPEEDFEITDRDPAGAIRGSSLSGRWYRDLSAIRIDR